MIAKWYKNMLKKHFEFKGIWKGSSWRKNEWNFKGKFSSKNDTNQSTQHGYELAGHMIKDCSNIKMKNERAKFKFKRADKRVMIAIWSDSDSSTNESEDEEIANLYHIAREISGGND